MHYNSYAFAGAYPTVRGLCLYCCHVPAAL